MSRACNKKQMGRVINPYYFITVLIKLSLKKSKVNCYFWQVNNSKCSLVLPGRSGLISAKLIGFLMDQFCRPHFTAQPAKFRK